MHTYLHQETVPQIIHRSTVHNSLPMEQPKYPAAAAWVIHTWHICAREYYTAVRVNELPLYAAMWMNLLNRNFSKRRQTQKCILCGSLHKSLKSILWKFTVLYTLIICILFLLCIYKFQKHKTAEVKGVVVLFPMIHRRFRLGLENVRIPSLQFPYELLASWKSFLLTVSIIWSNFPTQSECLFRKTVSVFISS